jgi:cation transport ATPase
MYDDNVKSVGAGGNGRMQQAVDEWEKSAKSAAAQPEEYDDGNFDAEVKDIIKNKINKINENRVQFTESKPKRAAHDKKTEPPALPAIKTETAEEDDEPLDYESEEQGQEILLEQERLKFSLTLKFVGSFICALVLAFLAAVPALGIQVPPFMDVNTHPSIYLGINMALLILTGIVGFSVAVKGIVSLFTLRPDADSLTSLAFYAALLGGGFTLYSFAVSAVPFANLPATAVFSSCAAAGVALNLFGKIFYVSRVIHNFKFISEAENVKNGFIAAEPLPQIQAQNIMKTFNGMPVIAETKKVRFLTNYLEQSYSETPADSAAKIFAPVTLVAAAIAAALEFLINSDAAGSVTVFTAICCVASPLLFEMGISVPLFRSGKQLLKQQAFVTGCETILDFGGTDAAVAEGSLIFPEHSASIYSVKTFSGHDIDNAVLYATSIACEAKSPLSGALMGIFADVGSGKKLLKTVEKLVYEDEKGLSAIIDGKVVLLGNRGILRHHMVESPSRDFELRYTANGKDIAYLAIDGKICAMFVIDYDLDDDSADAIHSLRHYGIRLLVKSSDPNITPQLIEERSDVPADNTVILGAREMSILEGDKGGGKAKSGLAFKNLSGYAAALVSCVKLKGSLRANTVLQVALSAVGVLLVAYCTFFGGGAAAITPAYVLAFQAICAVPVLLISLFRRC